MNPTGDARAALIDHGGEHTLAQARFCFPATLAVFAGHFPGAPLVPGVHLLACVVEAAARALGGPLRVRAIERAKWTAPVHPAEVLSAQARIAAVDGGWRLDGTVHGPAGVCATCRVLVERES